MKVNLLFLFWSCMPMLFIGCSERESTSKTSGENAAEAKELFISWQNPVSQRYAILEELDGMVWLYLTEPNSSKPIRDCPAFTTVPPLERVDWRSIAETGTPPPIDRSVASDTAMLKNPSVNDFEVKWSPNGESVAVVHKGSIICMIVADAKRGHSKSIKKASSLGLPFDEGLARKTFVANL